MWSTVNTSTTHDSEVVSTSTTCDQQSIHQQHTTLMWCPTSTTSDQQWLNPVKIPLKRTCHRCFNVVHSDLMNPASANSLPSDCNSLWQTTLLIRCNDLRNRPVSKCHLQSASVNYGYLYLTLSSDNSRIYLSAFCSVLPQQRDVASCTHHGKAASTPDNVVGHAVGGGARTACRKNIIHKHSSVRKAATPPGPTDHSAGTFSL